MTLVTSADPEIRPAASRRGDARVAIGLMSGTSLDGIDAALIITDGTSVLDRGPAATHPYAEAFRDRLRRLLGRRPGADDAEIIRTLTLHHAEAVRRLLGDAGLAAAAVDVVGFHGQTVWHRPEAGETIQIGDGQTLADALGIAVVGDFRSADVAAGGEGAPLAPLYHAALARDLPKPLAVLNLGGVGNVTWIGADEAECSVVAFDTGPGNALLDDWLRRTTGARFDRDGALAAVGIVDEGRLARWLDHPYLRRPVPKSLDRGSFAAVLAETDGLSPADGAATLAAFTARCVAAADSQLPAPPRRWLVTGGGRHNGHLMALLKRTLRVPVAPVESVGWRGDWIEAEAFAFLAVRAIDKLPLSLPTTTGIPRPLTGGVLFRPRGG